MKIDEALLTRYLVKHLKSLTEADPILLANYVVALLKNNKPKKDLQKLCIDQLLDFLGEGTKPFVLKLFHAIEDGTIPNSPEESPKTDAAIATAPALISEGISTMAHNGDKADPKALCQTEKASGQVERTTSTNDGLQSDQEECSDDEDDDRNHKHRRRASRSDSYDKDNQDEETSGPDRKRSRPFENGQPSRENDRTFSELPRGFNQMGKDVFMKNERRKIRHLPGEGIQRGGSRGLPTFRSEGMMPRFKNQNGLSRGILGRGRGGLNPWGSHEQRMTPFDGSDFSTGLVQTSASTGLLHSGRSIPSRGNPPHIPWGGYGQLSGMANGAIDQLIPLNSGMQGTRGVPMSTGLGVGVGVNLNMGLALGRPRCLDFEERGYCLRGDLCPMEHGANRIVVEDVQSLSQFNLPVALPSGRASSMPASGPPLSSFSSSIGLAGRSMGEAITPHLSESSSIVRGGLENNAGIESDLYNPDEPLWAKEHSDVSEGARRLPSLRKDHDEPYWEAGASEQRRIWMPPDVGISDKYGRSTTIVASSQAQVLGPSVWDRIGPASGSDAKAEGPFNSFLDGPPKPPRIEVMEELEANGSRDNLEGRQEQVRSPGLNVSIDKGHIIVQPLENVVHTFDRGNLRGRKMPPASDRAQRTLYVRCIPLENNRKELLLAHFQKFGEIMDIRIPVHSDRAFVQFLRREDAELALTSPDAVMGNRFIRLSWANRDSIQCSEESSKGVFPKFNDVIPHQLSLLPIDKAKSEGGASTVGPTPPVGSAMRPAMPSVFNGQSSPSGVAAQKKKEELEQMKDQIRRKQEELAKKRNEFRLKLEHLSKQGSSMKEEAEVDNSKGKQWKPDELQGLKSLAERNVMPSEQTAGGLVKPPDASRQALTSPGSMLQPPMRSPFQLSGAVGTGYLCSPQYGPSRYKLDNRTTIFRVLPPLPDALLDVKTLKEHFLNFGELADLEVENQEEGSILSKNSSVRLTFNSRHAAENAFVQGRWFQGTSLQVAWVNNAPVHANVILQPCMQSDTGKADGAEGELHDPKEKPMTEDRSPANDLHVQEVDDREQQAPLISSKSLKLDDEGEHTYVVGAITDLNR